MTEIKIEDIQNLNQPEVQELINKFKNKNDMNIVDTAEIVSILIKTLKLDLSGGRSKIYSISGEHLGKVLNIGKSIVSQYLNVWNMPQESKNYLKNYNLSLMTAYQVSRIKGKDEAETIRLQKASILEKNTLTGKRTDTLSHIISESEMILNGIVSSYKVPKEIFTTQPEKYISQKEKARICKENIEACIYHLSPKIARLPYLKKELEFCEIMIENSETKFCGRDITKECLEKQIDLIQDEIISIGSEQKLPHIASLIMMKNNLEKNI